MIKKSAYGVLAASHLFSGRERGGAGVYAYQGNIRIPWYVDKWRTLMLRGKTMVVPRGDIVLSQLMMEIGLIWKKLDGCVVRRSE